MRKKHPHEIYWEIAGGHKFNPTKRNRRRYWGKTIGPIVRYLGKTSIHGSKSKFSQWTYANGSYVVEDMNQ